MALLSWILVGGFAGWIASILTRTKNTGCFTNIIIGMIGSIIGGLIVSFFIQGQFNFTFIFTRFETASFLVSVIGAILFLGLLKLVKGRD